MNLNCEYYQRNLATGILYKKDATLHTTPQRGDIFIRIPDWGGQTKQRNNVGEAYFVPLTCREV